MRFFFQFRFLLSLVVLLGGMPRVHAAVIGSGHPFSSLIQTSAGILGVDANGIWISSDQGATFGSVYSVPGDLYFALAASGSTVVAVGETGLVARSTNGGNDWTQETSPSLFGDLISIATNGNGIWLATGDDFDSYLLRSTDDGQTWTELTAPLATGLRAVAWQADTGWILAGEGSFADGIVYRSSNDGESWQLLADGLAAPVNTVAINNAGEILLAGASGLLLQGTTATAFQSPAGYSPISQDFYAAIVSGSGAFLAGGETGVLFETDGNGVSDLSIGEAPDINALLLLANDDLLISGDYETPSPQERSIPFNLLLSRHAVSGDFVLTVLETLAHRSYRIEFSTDLQNWNEVVGSVRIGNDASMVWTFPLDGSRLFWRAVEF